LRRENLKQTQERRWLA